MKKLFASLSFAAVLTLAACGGGGDSSDEANSGDVDPEKIFNQSCSSCHGSDLTGTSGSVPDISTVGDRLSEDEIKDVIENGQGRMPGGLVQDQAELDALASWLADHK